MTEAQGYRVSTTAKGSPKLILGGWRSMVPEGIAKRIPMGAAPGGMLEYRNGVLVPPKNK